MTLSDPRHPLDRALELSRIDLHLHTTVSDGRLSADQVLAQAEKHGLEAFSVTDHDAADAYDALHPGIMPSGRLLITGTEIDTDAGSCDPEILGYGFDRENAALRQALSDIQQRRTERARQMILALNRALGREVLAPQDVLVPGRKSILKPHLTGPLVERGIFQDVPEARRFITEKLAPVPFPKPSPEQAIEWIQNAGGKAVLAHPAFLFRQTNLESLVARLAKAGLDGLEGEYPYRFTPSVFPDLEAERAAIGQITGLAERHDLLLTRGTDCHTLDDWQERHAV